MEPVLCKDSARATLGEISDALERGVGQAELQRAARRVQLHLGPAVTEVR